MLNLNFKTLMTASLFTLFVTAPTYSVADDTAAPVETVEICEVDEQGRPICYEVPTQVCHMVSTCI
jgi:hypothetical protein